MYILNNTFLPNCDEKFINYDAREKVYEGF